MNGRSRVVDVVALLVLTAAAQPALAQNSFGEATRAAAPAMTAPGPAQPPPQAQPPAQQRPTAQDFGQPVVGAAAAAPTSAAADSPERQDYGVPPSTQLHAGQMHAPTPASIPGGQVITTVGLVELMRSGQAPFVLLDVLGGPNIIQGAQYAVPAAQSGSFSDAVQQQFGQFLEQATRGNKQYPLVLYCQSTHCWMSYNAALRAINLGYTNVLWYRGGIEAWQNAGMPVQRAQ